MKKLTKRLRWNGDLRKLLFFTIGVTMVLASSHPVMAGLNPRPLAGTLSAPVLISPQNYSAVGFSSGDTLAWGAVTGARSYLVQLSTDSTFTSKDLIVVDSVVAGDRFVLPSIKPQTFYFWRVLAANGTDTSAWSTTWAFTSGAPPPPVPISPAAGSSYRPSPISLSWSSPWADSYRVQLAVYNGDFSFSSGDMVLDTVLSSDSVRIRNLELSATYYWHVSGRNKYGFGEWSATETFSTSGLPTVWLVTPADLDRVNPPSVTCSWLTTTGAVAYEFQLSLDGYFNSPPIIDTTIKGTSVIVNALASGEHYYWRVRAQSNVNGIWGSWYSYEFYTYPSAPTLLAPSNRKEIRAANPILRWKTTIGASYYRIQVADDSSFKSVVLDSTTSSAVDSLAIDTLAPNSEFFWHVKGGSDVNGWSSYSSIWTFSTTSLPPLSPKLTQPRDSTLISPLGVMLSWNPVPGADRYLLQLSTDSTFKTLYLDDSTLTTDSFSVGSLNTGTTYFWRVKAGSNAAGWGTFTAFYRFSTTPYILPAPDLASPADSARNLPTSLTLNWLMVSRAQVYQVQVSQHTSFDTMIVNDSTITADSVSIKSLVRGFRYYWRVRAGLGGDRWSPYSLLRTFTAEPWTQAATLTLSTQVTYSVHSDISQFHSDDYRLVGLPGAGYTPMAKVFEGTPQKDWEAYWDNGAESNYFIKYDASDTFDLGAGRGYWLIHNGPLQVNATVSALSLDSLGQVKIPIHPGWNIITDPFVIDVPWDTVGMVNHVSEPIWSFNGSFQVAASLIPYQGYYFFNADSLGSLVIPYMESQTSVAVSSRFMKATSMDSGWLVHVALSAAGAIDSSLWFGASKVAGAGFNRYDVHKPRTLGSEISIYFLHPDWDHDFGAFASEVHPSFSDTSEWTFDANAIPGKPASLTFGSMNQLPAEFDAYLCNAEDGSWVNLRQVKDYTFVPRTSNTTFKILVGRPSLVNAIVAKSHAEVFRLGVNYPNPFNPSTVITYQLAASGHVTLRVYDILGRKVTTLVDGEQAAGVHSVEFNGSRLASGVYFYRLVTSTHESTRKMVLLK